MEGQNINNQLNQDRLVSSLRVVGSPPPHPLQLLSLLVCVHNNYGHIPTGTNYQCGSVLYSQVCNLTSIQLLSILQTYYTVCCSEVSSYSFQVLLYSHYICRIWCKHTCNVRCLFRALHFLWGCCKFKCLCIVKYNNL